MTELAEPRWGSLFIAILAQEDQLDEAEVRLNQAFGPLDLKSPAFRFTFTDYYHAELGSDLWRRFVAVVPPVAQDALPEIKNRTRVIERDLSVVERGADRRRVNLDPGYLTPAKIVLASTKDCAHRVYLGRGIFGDLHLVYEQGAYQPLPWTYPDYRTPEALSFFTKLRSRTLAAKDR